MGSSHEENAEKTSITTNSSMIDYDPIFPLAFVWGVIVWLLYLSEGRSGVPWDQELYILAKRVFKWFLIIGGMGSIISIASMVFSKDKEV